MVPGQANSRSITRTTPTEEGFGFTVYGLGFRVSGLGGVLRFGVSRFRVVGFRVHRHLLAEARLTRRNHRDDPRSLQGLI